MINNNKYNVSEGTDNTSHWNETVGEDPAVAKPDGEVDAKEQVETKKHRLRRHVAMLIAGLSVSAMAVGMSRNASMQNRGDAGADREATTATIEKTPYDHSELLDVHDKPVSWGGNEAPDEDAFLYTYDFAENRLYRLTPGEYLGKYGDNEHLMSQYDDKRKALMKKLYEDNDGSVIVDPDKSTETTPDKSTETDDEAPGEETQWRKERPEKRDGKLATVELTAPARDRIVYQLKNMPLRDENKQKALSMSYYNNDYYQFAEVAINKDGVYREIFEQDLGMSPEDYRKAKEEADKTYEAELKERADRVAQDDGYITKDEQQSKEDWGEWHRDYGWQDDRFDDKVEVVVD